MENKQQKMHKLKTTITYTLFKYQEELRRRNALHLRLSKIHLTDGLISKNVQNIERLNASELKNLNREILYQQSLKLQFKKLLQLRKSRTHAKDNVKSNKK